MIKGSKMPNNAWPIPISMTLFYGNPNICDGPIKSCIGNEASTPKIIQTLFSTVFGSFVIRIQPIK